MQKVYTSDGPMVYWCQAYIDVWQVLLPDDGDTSQEEDPV